MHVNQYEKGFSVRVVVFHSQFHNGRGSMVDCVNLLRRLLLHYQAQKAILYFVVF